METRFLRSESPPEGRAKYRNNIPPTAVVMGGRDWFQASVSAVGIPAVASSDSGRDSHRMPICAPEEEG